MTKMMSNLCKRINSRKIKLLWVTFLISFRQKIKCTESQRNILPAACHPLGTGKLRPGLGELVTVSIIFKSQKKTRKPDRDPYVAPNIKNI